MAQYLQDKRIVLGVTGSIAAYKSADLVRRLREAGAVVRVVMTQQAKEFITPLTMQAVSGNPVHDHLFDLEAEAAMGHIELARWADLIIIAPASADCLARLANGKADDLMTAVSLATKAPVAVAPAMNQGMWEHTSTQANVQAVSAKGISVFGPGEGSQACGEVGLGRMLEPLQIIELADQLFSTDLLAGLRVLVTAGPTHEAIDPVRYIANGSSGKMGYALAAAAREAGASVTLISGPVHLPVPRHMACQSVTTAQEMHDAVMSQVANYDIVLAVAAVADYRCQTISATKLPKDSDTMTITLTRNPDIVASIGALTNKPFLVGFAAETDDVLNRARAKKQRKNMDIIIANQVGEGKGIGSDNNTVTVISNQGEIILDERTKNQLARELINLIAGLYRESISVRPELVEGRKIVAY